MNILVTGVGGPTPRSFVRAVKLSSDPRLSHCRFIGVDCNQLAYGLYDNIFDQAFLVPRADAPDYWSRIKEIVDSQTIDAAVVLPELEVLEWAKSSHHHIPHVKTHLPDFGLAELLIDKFSLHLALQDSTVVPRFSLVEPTDFSYAAIARDLGDRFWIRGTVGSSGLGSLLIESDAVLKNWMAINPDVDQFIATEYLPGRNFACKLLYFNNQLMRTACAERVTYIMSKVAPSGITGNTAFGRLINDPSLVQVSASALQTIAESLNVPLNGIFTVDLKEDDQGAPKITEINVRHVAFTHAIAAGGANLPADTLIGMQDPSRLDGRIDYQFPSGMIFLRDVDGLPLIFHEDQLL